MQEILQYAVDAVQEHAKRCGLQCAPKKSELLIFRKKGYSEPVVVYVGGAQMQEVRLAKSLGLLVAPIKGNNAEMIRRFKATAEEVARIISRVSNHKHGLKEK